MTPTYVVVLEANNETTIWRGNGVNPIGESYVTRLLPGLRIGIDVTLREIERRMTEHGLRPEYDERISAEHLHASLVRLFFGFPGGSQAPLCRVVYDESLDLDVDV